MTYEGGQCATTWYKQFIKYSNQEVQFTVQQKLVHRHIYIYIYI